MDSPRYDRAAEAARKITEALETREFPCKAVLFGLILFAVLDAIYEAEDDARRRNLTASRN